jgi:hypothetical protein
MSDLTNNKGDKTMHTFPAFDKYACAGDTRTIEAEGFTVTARIEYDDCTDAPDERQDGFWPSKNPKDAGYVLPHNYDEQMKRAEETLQAWRNDEWFYCGVVLTVTKDINIPGRTQSEVVISKNAASLWGIECNYPGSDNSYLAEVANELLPEALDFAREAIKQLTKED